MPRIIQAFHLSARHKLGIARYPMPLTIGSVDASVVLEAAEERYTASMEVSIGSPEQGQETIEVRLPLSAPLSKSFKSAVDGSIVTATVDGTGYECEVQFSSKYGTWKTRLELVAGFTGDDGLCFYATPIAGLWAVSFFGTGSQQAAADPG